MASFVEGDYDVVLGMLERRIDGPNPRGASRLRTTVVTRLGTPEVRPAPVHRAIGKLAAVGGVFRVATTNFDLLFERVRRPRPPTYSLGSIPRPTLRPEFTGVFHIHGALPHDRIASTDLVLTDQDFGDAYLRKRGVSDFIYDAARLYHLVLVGYSANDPPMRYLLNAIAGDSAHFSDLKERFSFVAAEPTDNIELERWHARGIVPIPYDPKFHHVGLLEVLEEWANVAAVGGGPTRTVDRNIRRILKSARQDASDADRDLFDHLVRRRSPDEQIRIAGLARRSRAEPGWLDAMRSIIGERPTP
ncbi:MAG: SIR2 family protein [Gammaproteobacteria bacterium]|nr:SIR2 family protein [Gammaproteobacteria bacterium]